MKCCHLLRVKLSLVNISSEATLSRQRHVVMNYRTQMEFLESLAQATGNGRVRARRTFPCGGP